MRSYAGCWTCRLRRKKCDEGRPICGGCVGLGISCHYRTEKPDWMDGGNRQKEMGEQLKNEVRLAAARRREGEGEGEGVKVQVQLFMTGEDQGLVDGEQGSISHVSSQIGRDGNEFIHEAETRSIDAMIGESMDVEMEEAEERNSTGPTISPGNTNTNYFPSSYDTSGSHAMPISSLSLPTITSSLPQPHHAPNQATATENTTTSQQSPGAQAPNSPNPYSEAVDNINMDRSYIMLYLDYIFPILYPFYRPSLLEGGRGWVLELIMECPPLFHTTMCLSAYFFSTIITSTPAGQGHEGCKELAWQKLLRTTDKTFQVLRGKLQEDVTDDGKVTCVREVARMMGAIVQLQRFELLVASFENCEAHLNAAVTLFGQLLHSVPPSSANEADRTRYGSGTRHADFKAVLKTMGRGLDGPFPDELELRSWTYDQAALRFFTAHLLVDDIILSTCLSRPPLLAEYHAHLLIPSVEGAEPHINLAEFMGCENTIMIQISSIATLDAWKKESSSGGRLDMMDLFRRADPIKRLLEDQIQTLENRARSDLDQQEGQQEQNNNNNNNNNSNNPRYLENIFPIYTPTSTHPSPSTNTTFASLVWAHATLIYLTIVISGWQPSNATIRTCVSKILSLLTNPPSPSLFHAMAWPFCVAGCLAQQGDQEARFRAFMSLPLLRRDVAGGLGWGSDCGGDGTATRSVGRMLGTMGRAMDIMERVWERRDETMRDWDLAGSFACLGYPVLLV